MTTSMVIKSSALLAFALTLQASAETKTWTGGGGWNDAASWEPNGAPAASDTVVFASSASVEVPPSFVGVLQVQQKASVTASFVADTELTIGLDSGAILTKSGLGRLTAHARAGLNPGSLIVANGPVTFAGNGTGFGSAPGAFGAVTLKSGISASVAQSPIDSRHGGSYQFGKSKDIYYTGGWDSYSWMRGITYATYCANYAQVTNIDESVRFSGVLTPNAGETFHNAPCMFQDELNQLAQRGLVGYARVLFLGGNACKTSATFTLAQTQNNMCLRLFVNGAAQIGGWPTSGTSISFTPTLNAGWNEFAIAYIEDLTSASTASSPRSPSFVITHDKVFPADDTKSLTCDSMWNGACCETLVVEKGAQMAVPAGQAFAVASTTGSSIAEGSVVSGGSSAVFTLAGGRHAAASNALLLASFSAFAGTLELGPSAQVMADATAASAAYTIIGKGEIGFADGLLERISSDAFFGTLNIPFGTTIALPQALAGHVNLAGAGTVQGADVAATLLTRELTDGESLTLNQGSVSGVEPETVPDFSDTTSWGWFRGSETLSVPTLKNSPWVLENTCPRLDDRGRLVLNDKTGYQFTSAYLTNIVFQAADEWEISFKCRSWRNPDYQPQNTGADYGVTSDALSGGMAFGFKPANGKDFIGAGYWGATARPASFCGFYYGGWKDSSTRRYGYCYYANRNQGSVFAEADFPNGDFTCELQVNLRGSNGKMYATVTGNGHVESFVCALDPVFADGAGAQFGFVGEGDGNGAAASKLWAYQEVWDFHGTIRPASKASATTAVAGSAWGDNGNWATNTVASGGTTMPPEWTDANTLVLSHNAGEAKFCTRNSVIARNGIEVGRPFRFSFDYTNTRGQTGYNQGSDQRFAAYVQTEGADVVFKECNNSGVANLPKNTPAWGFSHGSYGYPKLCWTSPSGSPATTALAPEGDLLVKVWANQLNHVELTYDGAQTMSLTIDFPDGTSIHSATNYANLIDGSYAGKKFYPTISAAKDFNCGNISVKNVKFEELYWPDPAVYSSPLRIAADAAATLKLGGWSQTANLDLALGSVDLADDATLDLEKETIDRSVRIDELTVRGAATVNAGDGVALTLKRVTYADAATGPLTVSGSLSVTDDFVVIISRSIVRERPVIMDLSAAKFAFDASAIRILDEDGVDLKATGRAVVLVKDGKVSISPCGLIFIMR